MNLRSEPYELHLEIVAFTHTTATRKTREKATYLCGPVLRSALGVGELALPALPAIEAIVSGVWALGHHASWTTDGRIDVLVVRTCAAGAGHVAVAVGGVVRRADDGGELSAKVCREGDG